MKVQTRFACSKSHTLSCSQHGFWPVSWENECLCHLVKPSNSCSSFKTWLKGPFCCDTCPDLSFMPPQLPQPAPSSLSLHTPTSALHTTVQWLKMQLCMQRVLGSNYGPAGGLWWTFHVTIWPWFFSHLQNSAEKSTFLTGLGEICTNLSWGLAEALTTLYYKYLFKCLSPSLDLRAEADSDLSFFP